MRVNTSKVERAVSGLVGFTNAAEGHVTCTDAGKHSLRGKSLTPNGQPCTDEGINRAAALPHRLCRGYWETILDVRLRQRASIS